MKEYLTEKYKCLEPMCGFKFASAFLQDIRCCPVCKYDQVEHESHFGKSLTTPDVPTDALVEACRDTIARLGVLTDTRELCEENKPYIMDTREGLIEALAAHEKAVR